MKQSVLFCVLVIGFGINVANATSINMQAYSEVVLNAPVELDRNGLTASLADFLDQHPNDDITEKTLIATCKKHVSSDNPCGVCYTFTQNVIKRHNELIDKANTEKICEVGGEKFIDDGRTYGFSAGMCSKYNNDNALDLTNAKSCECICHDNKMNCKINACQEDKGYKLQDGVCVKAEQGEPGNHVEDGDVVKITIDLDGGTPVRGNCSEVIINSGTPVTLDCDAEKGGKKLLSYVGENGQKYDKNSQFVWAGELRTVIPRVLKAIYEEDVEREENEEDVVGTGQTLQPVQVLADTELVGFLQRELEAKLAQQTEWKEKLGDSAGSPFKYEKSCITSTVDGSESCLVVGMWHNNDNGYGVLLVINVDKNKVVELRKGPEWYKYRYDPDKVWSEYQESQSVMDGIPKYKYDCHINTIHVQLEKASDAKTAADLACVFFANKQPNCKSVLGDRSMPSIHDLFDVSQKKAVYYCTKSDMANWSENVAAVCCSLQGEDVVCNTGRSFSKEMMSNITPTFDDCK